MKRRLRERQVCGELSWRLANVFCLSGLEEIGLRGFYSGAYKLTDASSARMQVVDAGPDASVKVFVW